MTTVEPDTLRLAAIVKASGDAIISHSVEGVIETWNPAAEELFGFTSSEAVGRSIEMIVAEDRRDDERRLTDDVRIGGTIHHFASVGLTKSGKRLHLSVALSPLVTPDGAILGVARIARDVSREQLAERELARLAAIVGSADDAIVSKDLNGIVQTWNIAAERMFGYLPDEIIGRS